MARTAIVTGSTSGIGLGVAHRLAASGINIMLNGFGDAGEIEAIRTDIAATHGVAVGYHGADISDADQIHDLVATTASQIGPVDILVNNAGIQFTADITAFPRDRWDKIIAINLSGVFHGMQAALPGMIARGWGRIINIASVHGLVASKRKAAYVAAKHGVVGLTKVAALETAKQGVTVNAICPGWVLTPLVQKQIEDQAAEQNVDFETAKRGILADKQPSMDFVTPEQLGDLAVFLASDSGAQLTGQAIGMDGGWLAQ